MGHYASTATGSGARPERPARRARAGAPPEPPVCGITAGRKAFFFRSFTATAELKRKRGAALVSRQGTFSVVEESIFVFDDQIDCFVFGDYVYVVRKRDFRRIFNQLTAVLRRAKRAARDLHGKVPIANFAAFEQACATDSRLADKVLAVRQRDYFDQLSYE